MTEDHLVTKCLFKVPLYERVIMGNKIANKQMCMELDGIGFYLHYDEDWQPKDPDWIRRHLVGKSETWALVEADDLQEAIRTIIDKWVGCKIGGKTEESKALWINRKLPIKELPPCKDYWLREQYSDVACGKPDEYGGAGCIFSGFDGFEGCPGIDYSAKTSKTLKNGHWVDQVTPTPVIVDGLEYKFITWRSL